MKRLDFYFDYACPWCYMGSKTIRELSKEGVNVEYHVWKMPSNVTPPPKPPGYYEAGKARLKELQKETGLPIKDPIQKDTVPALLATKAAQKMGAAEKYVEAVFHAHWAASQDISDRETLVSLAKQIGLDETEFRKELEEGEAEKELQRDLQKAEKLKISTIPSYISGTKQLLVHHFDDMPTLSDLRELCH